MSPLLQLWHVLNFVAPALVTAVVTATLVKLLWRRDLAAVGWLRLCCWGSGAGLLALGGGLVLLGRDGTMAAYGAMVAAIALALWAVGFGPWRPRSG